MKQIPPAKVKIEHTYDYSKFKLVGVNRSVDKKHVKDIADSMLRRNLMHLFPLIVNEKFEIMDGQHRLGAVKLIKDTNGLSLPAYYIVDPDITIDDISLLNSNKVNWGNLDYINFYACKMNKNYIEILKLMKRYKWMKLSTAITLLSSHKRDVKVLKSGDFKADRIEQAYFVAACVEELGGKIRSYYQFWKGTAFCSALNRIVRTKQYKHQVMMNSKLLPDIESQHTEREFIHELQKVYNSGRSEKVNFVQQIKP